MDTSGISPVLKQQISLERLLQLKEIQDRIDLPPLADIPDAEAMARLPYKRWRLPGTEIDFVPAPDEQRGGEYVLSAETVARLPEFYDKVAKLPYRPGPAQRLNEAFRTLSSGKTETIYEAFLSSPVGLASIVPLRWMLNLPGWARVPFAGVSAWQWFALGVGLAIGGLLIFASQRLTRRPAGRGEDDPGTAWWRLLVPVAIIIVAGVLTPMLCLLLHIGGVPRVVLAFLETITFALSAAWLCIVSLIIVGDLVVSSEHLKRSSLDSQLIRLGARLVGVIFAVAA